jgi:hypothetical protein
MTAAANPSLVGLFDRPNTEHYWHHLAKTKSSKKFYQKTEDLTKIEREIQARLGSCSFDRQESEHRWTPLHVAVLSGNTPAAEFFLRKQAKTDLPDASGKIAEDYMTEPDESNYRELVRQLLPKPGIALPATPFHYDGSTNDFGIIIKELLFPKIPPDWFIRIQDLASVASKEGFTLSEATQELFLRDYFVRLRSKSGQLTLLGSPCTAENSTPSDMERQYKKIKAASDKNISKMAYFQEEARFTVRNYCFVGTLGSTLPFKDHAYQEARQQYPSGTTYHCWMPIEGGNMFTLTNTQGNRKILIGKDHLAQIHAQWRLSYTNTSNPADIPEDIPDRLLRTAAEEMYAMGFLKLPSGRTGLLSLEQIRQAWVKFYASKEESSFQSVLVQEGFLTPLPWTEDFIASIEKDVLTYVAERKSVKENVALLFETPVDDVHFIPQFAYHLDIFMKPGPKGSIFLQDFECCTHVLEQMRARIIPLGLTFEEYKQVIKYLNTAKMLHAKIGPSLKQTKEELERAGFMVIPTPGLFYDENLTQEGDTYHVNFLNAISGWSETQNHYFYITTGVQVGKRLGRLFMDVFAQFVKQYEPNLEVYFIGENPKKPGDFSEATKLFNQFRKDEKTAKGPMAGLHCMTFEKQTASHIG